jgi:hypothetical protein
MSEFPQSEYPQQEYPSSSFAETNVLALISLISGVLAWLGLFGLGGVVAVITGHIAKNQIRASMGQQTGEGLANAGLVLGYLNIVLTLVVLCLGVLMFAGVISSVAICPFVVEGCNW